MMNIQLLSGTILLLLLAVYDSMAPPGQEGHNDPFNYNWFKPDSDEQIVDIVGTSNPAPQTHPIAAAEPAQNAEPQGLMVGSGLGDTSGLLASITPAGRSSQSAPSMATPMQVPTVGQDFHGTSSAALTFGLEGLPIGQNASIQQRSARDKQNLSAVTMPIAQHSPLRPKQIQMKRGQNANQQSTVTQVDKHNFLAAVHELTGRQQNASGSGGGQTQHQQHIHHASIPVQNSPILQQQQQINFNTAVGSHTNPIVVADHAEGQHQHVQQQQQQSIDERRGKAPALAPSVSELKGHLAMIQQQFAHIQQTKQHFEQSITVAQLKHDPKIKADWHKLKFQTESLRLQEIDLIQHLNPVPAFTTVQEDHLKMVQTELANTEVELQKLQTRQFVLVAQEIAIKKSRDPRIPLSEQEQNDAACNPGIGECTPCNEFLCQAYKKHCTWTGNDGGCQNAKNKGII